MLLQASKLAQNVKIDTVTIVKTVHDTVKVSANDSLELISKIDNFYSNSWDKLIWVVGVLITIGVVVIPIAIQYYQKSKLKLSEEKLKTENEERISEELTALKEDITKKFSENLLELKQEIKNEFEEALAELIKKNDENLLSIKTFSQNYTESTLTHLQGVINYGKGNYIMAARDFIKSLEFSLLAEETSLENTFKNIENSLLKSNKIDFDRNYQADGVTFLAEFKKLEERIKEIGYEELFLKILEIYKNLK